MTEYILKNQETWQMFVRVASLYVIIYLTGAAFHSFKAMLFIKNIPVEKINNERVKEFFLEAIKYIFLSWLYYLNYSTRNEKVKYLFKEWE